MLIVICPITYWILLHGEFTTMWRVVSLMWWMTLIELLTMCGGVSMKKNLCVRLCLLFIDHYWWGGINVLCHNWGIWYGGEGYVEVWIIRYPGLGRVHLWFWYWGSICQYYQDRFWCRRAAQSLDLEGDTQRGAEQNGCHEVMPCIVEWDGSGKSGT